MGLNDFVTLCALIFSVGGMVLALVQAKALRNNEESSPLAETLQAHIEYANLQIETNVRNITDLQARVEEERDACQRAVQEIREQYQQSRREHEACERDRANLQRQLIEIMNQQPRRGGGL